MNDFTTLLEQGLAEEKRVRAENFCGEDKRGRESTAAELVDQVEAKARPWLKVGAGAATLISILVGWGVVANPIPTKAQVSEALASRDVRIDQNSHRIDQLEGRVDRIDTNTAKSLRLQLRGSVRDLLANIDALPKGSPARKALEATLDQTQSDLEDVERQLAAGNRP